MKEIIYQSEKITFASGTAEHTFRSEFILNSSYERCVGIGVIESQTGGISSYRIGLEDGSGNVVISPVHKNFVKSDTAAGLKLENRVLPVNIKAGGQKVKVITEIPTALTADLEYDIVFVLEREKPNR